MPMKIIRNAGVVVIFFLVTLMLSGCMTTRKGETSPVSSKETRASYYDFDDILIPSELSLDKKYSMVYTTGRLKAGMLVFGGRVEPSSLSSFFQGNMQKDGWILLSSFKYRQYQLVFLKEDRVCVVTITEKTFSTTAEVRVGPIEQGIVAIKGPQPR
jgi:hypothetical protein